MVATTDTPAPFLLVVRQEKGRTALVAHRPLPLTEADLKRIQDLPGVTDSFLPQPHYLNIRFDGNTDWEMDLVELVLEILGSVIGPDILLLGADLYNMLGKRSHILTVEQISASGKTVELTRYGYEPGAEPYRTTVLNAIVAKLNDLPQVSDAQRLLPSTVKVSFGCCFSWHEGGGQEAVRQAIEEVVSHEVIFAD